MKKILTVLLSFLMVATLGIVNVSAETDDDYEYLNYDGINIKITGKKSTTFTYNGEEQTLYTLTCTGGQRSNYGECTYKYAISTSSSTSDESIKWKDSTSNDKNQILELKATDAGTYYLHLKKPGDDGSHNIWGYGNGSAPISHSVTIERKDTTVTINEPTASGTVAGNPYYIVSKSSGNVVLPFTNKADVEGVTTKWENATITGPNDGAYSGSDIAFSTDDGKLTIKAVNLATGSYKVVLKASVDESVETTPTKNYKGSVEKTIYIYKVDDQTNFTVGFNGDSIPQRENNIIYGKTAQDIINAVSSVEVANDTIYGTEGNPTSVVTAETYIEKKTSNGGGSYTKITDNSETLSVVDNDAYYRITVRLKHKYGTGDGDVYYYNVRDTFKIVRKDASATVTATKQSDGSSLVYNGNNQVLATAKDINPTSDSSTDAASIKYKVVPGAQEEIATQESITENIYNQVSAQEVDSPTAKDAGRYSIYFHVQHGSSGNYQDSYGVITNKIERATLTVTGLDVDPITYDGEEHKPNITVSGFVDDKTQSDVEITYATYKDGKTAYKDVVDDGWTTKVKIYNNSSDGHSNLKNYKFVDADGKSVTELSATLTINKATAKIVDSKTTKTYYKNNGGRATITCTGLLGDFDKLQVSDGSEWKEVTYSQTVSDSLYVRKTDSNGNTIIELRQAYLQSKDDTGKANFEVGKKYKFRLVYGDNYTSTYPETTLSIENYTAPSNNSSSSSSTTTTAKKVVNTAAQ